MQVNSISLDIVLDNGTVITQYSHNGKFYVEGRAGTAYKIRIKNNTHKRVEAVVSVDGKSVTTGETAGAHSTGYVINGYQSIDIPGWKLAGNENAARFEFGSAKQSYAAKKDGGDTANVGVIGVAVYDKKERMYAQNALRGGMMTLSASSASAPMTKGNTQGLGTAFGEKTEFRTKSVDFDRGNHRVTLAIHYDDLRGLQERGVISKAVPAQHEPNPFPVGGVPAAAGCEPPEGWNG